MLVQKQVNIAIRQQRDRRAEGFHRVSVGTENLRIDGKRSRFVFVKLKNPRKLSCFLFRIEIKVLV